MREDKSKRSLCTLDTLFSEESLCGFVVSEVLVDVIAPLSPSLVQDYVTWQRHRGHRTEQH